MTDRDEIPKLVLNYAPAPPKVTRRRVLGDIAGVCAGLFWMSGAIVIAFVDLAILGIALAFWGDARNIDQQIAAIIVGGFAVFVLGVAALDIWFAGLRRIRGRDKMD
jgi:small basic protein